MRKEDVSLIPPVFVTERNERFLPEKRLWQSAPSAARTKGGRIFCVYSADNCLADETTNNYNVCAYSDDGGEHYSLAFYAYHTEAVRISEALLFLSPEGVLYHFWTQSYGYFDGRGGVFCRTCREPDAATPVFDEPRRICDGFMADNPTVLKSGEWLFPASIWTHLPSDYHPFPAREMVSVWSSRDKGESLTFLGGVKPPVPDFNENTVFETATGEWVMLFRTTSAAGGIQMTRSADHGESWTRPQDFTLKGPSSRFMVSRFPSGALLMVTHHHFIGRNNLTALLSYDDGKTFPYSLLLDERDQVSYPSGNVAEDGRVTLAYDRERTGAREILLASFTEEDIRNGTLGADSFTKKTVVVGGQKGGI